MTSLIESYRDMKEGGDQRSDAQIRLELDLSLILDKVKEGDKAYIKEFMSYGGLDQNIQAYLKDPS